MIGSFKGQRGGGRVGCLVSLALLGLFLYCSLKVIPVFLDKFEFEEDFQRLVSQAGAQAFGRDAIDKNLTRIADLHEFEIVPKSLSNERKVTLTGPPELVVQVSYFRVVEFPGFEHRFEFRVKASTFVGRL